MDSQRLDRDGRISRPFASDQDVEAYQELVRYLNECPVPPGEILANLSLFLTRSELSRILFLHGLYQRIIDVPGVVMEFGVRWGRNQALWTTCRAMYEPYNVSRQVLGFDTFAGFPSVAPEDGQSESVAVGRLTVTEDYDAYLDGLLDVHERLAPQAHVRKHALVRGDMTQTLPRYLEAHPETIIALAYFDVDLYEPTRVGLEVIRPYLTRGSVVAFDELLLPDYPGETIAIREAIGLDTIRLQREPLSGHRAYFVVA
jgi:hypothetical protein